MGPNTFTIMRRYRKRGVNRRHTRDRVRRGSIDPNADIPVIHALAVPMGRLGTRRQSERDVQVDSA
jgi:hypothetical protein